MFDVARLLGDALREVEDARRPVPGAEQHRRVARTSSSAARSAASRRGCSTSTAKATSSRPRRTPAISRSARPSTASRSSTAWSTRRTSLHRRDQVHDGVVRLDDALEHLGRAADRPARLRGRLAARQAAAAHRRDDPYFQMVHTPVGRGPAPRVRAAARTPTGREQAYPDGDPRRAAAPHDLPLRPAGRPVAARDPAAAGAALPHADPRLLAQRRRPDKHFLNWQQDPYGNWVARLVFPERADSARDRRRPRRPT